MAIGVHGRAYHDGDAPGLVARKQQLAQALKDAEPASEAGGSSMGSVSATQGVAKAKAALQRQQRYAAGQYPVPE